MTSLLLDMTLALCEPFIRLAISSLRSLFSTSSSSTFRCLLTGIFFQARAESGFKGFSDYYAASCSFLSSSIFTEKSNPPSSSCSGGGSTALLCGMRNLYGNGIDFLGSWCASITFYSDLKKGPSSFFCCSGSTATMKVGIGILGMNGFLKARGRGLGTTMVAVEGCYDTIYS